MPHVEVVAAVVLQHLEVVASSTLLLEHLDGVPVLHVQGFRGVALVDPCTIERESDSLNK